MGFLASSSLLRRKQVSILEALIQQRRIVDEIFERLQTA